jgi:hypothetical protein
MVSAVRSRPNHYELLGIGPRSSDEEIKRAFARKMSLFGAHLMAEAPQISVAYETLRDPARRRNYDRTLGLNVGPEPRPWGFTVAPPRWSPLLAQPARPHRDEPHVESEAAPAPAPPKPSPEATEPLLDLYERMEKRSYGAREPRFKWKQPAMAAAGLLVGAGLIGGFAGLSVKDNAASAKAEPTLSVALPAARAEPSEAAPAADTETAPELPPAAAAPKPRRIPQPQRPTGARTSWADQMAQSLSPNARSVAGDGQAPADIQPAEVVAASLPLSNQVIARTIDRIGYRCGKVVASEAGERGFTVTCTSGQTYEARPVNGRYRFRRVAG